MAIEHASSRSVAKPWGRKDLHPWNRDDHGGASIGEIWFGRPGPQADGSRLLLKLLFTSEPLSIQVHPDDTQAQAAGLSHGKTEAWYVLAADAAARVALGPDRPLTLAELRASVVEGRVADIVRWLPAAARDAFVVPAGTIHAIGAGLAIAEIQQRSDITYRLFDHGRLRGLQVEEALAVACLSPAQTAVAAIPLRDGRSAIAVTPFFVLERVRLAAGSSWQLDAQGETWVLALEGDIEIAGVAAGVGEAIFLEADRAVLVVGIDDAILLMAYDRDQPDPDLLRPLAAMQAGPRVDLAATAGPTNPRMPPTCSKATAGVRP